jgi:hypothetical protein
MSTRWQRISAMSVLVLCACATQTTGPATSSRGAGDAPQVSMVPDPARVYADLLGKTEDLPRVKSAPKEYDGRNIVLYGLRNGDLRPVEGRFSMPLASTDGKTVINAADRPGNNQFYLVVPDDFAREARERKMLVTGARGPVFIECKVSAQAAGKTTSYPCEIMNLVLIAGDRISDTLWRAKDRTLEYHRY